MKITEAFHRVVDALSEVQELSQRRIVSVSYQGRVGISIRVYADGSYAGYVGNVMNIYEGENWDIEAQLINVMEEIKAIKEAPELEPTVQVKMLRSKALELGLLA